MIDDQQIQRTILDLLAQRDAGKTICPSEAARRLDPVDWRPLMDDVRRVAAQLTASGTIEVTQGGEAIELASAKGPIRLRLVTKATADG